MSNFSPEFLAAVVDTLLPGLPAAAIGDPQGAALPAATEIGVDRQLAAHLMHHPQRDRLAQRLALLAQLAGGEHNFSSADETDRTATMQALEATDAAAFDAFLLVVTADYYQTETVIHAMGWPVEPPQPHGYPLPPFTEALLAPVKTRPPLWRA